MPCAASLPWARRAHSFSDCTAKVRFPANTATSTVGQPVSYATANGHKVAGTCARSLFPYVQLHILNLRSTSYCVLFREFWFYLGTTKWWVTLFTVYNCVFRNEVSCYPSNTILHIFCDMSYTTYAVYKQGSHDGIKLPKHVTHNIGISHRIFKNIALFWRIIEYLKGDNVFPNTHRLNVFCFPFLRLYFCHDSGMEKGK